MQGRYTVCAEDQLKEKQGWKQLFYYSAHMKRKGVGVFLKKKYLNNVVSDRIMNLKLEKRYC